LINTSLNINKSSRTVNAPLEALHTYFYSGPSARFIWGPYRLSKPS